MPPENVGRLARRRLMGVVAAMLIFGGAALISYSASVEAQVAGQIETFCPTQNVSENGVACNDTYGLAPISGDLTGAGRFYTWNTGTCSPSLCGVRLINSQAVWRGSNGNTYSRLIFEGPDLVDYDFCGVPSANQVGVPDSPYSVEFDFRSSTPSSGPAVIGIANQESHPAYVVTAAKGFMGLEITTGNVFQFRYAMGQSVTGTAAFSGLTTHVPGTTYHVTFSEVTCRQNSEPADEVSGMRITLTDGVSTANAFFTGSTLATTVSEDFQFLYVGPTVNSYSVTIDVDNLKFNGVPSQNLVANQIAVTGLVGYSMDSSGRTIITRENSGANVRTYPASDVSSGSNGVFATPDCARVDGVYAGFASDDIFTSFFDCNVSGETTQLHIKSDSLGSPNFHSCDEDLNQEEISENDMAPLEDFELPNEMRQMGSLADSYIDFSDCDTAFLNEALISWTYSDLDGRVGVYAVSIIQESGGGSLTITDDRTSVLLDPSGTPEVTSFCSWVNNHDPNRNDWFGAVTQNGPTALYSGEANRVGGPAGGEQVDAVINQEYLNTGSNAFAFGIDCAQDNVVIYQSGRIREFTNVSTSPVLVKETTAATGGAYRGVAMSGDANFLAWRDGASLIHIGYAGNHTIIDNVTVPAGTWQGMEWDYAAQRLAIFTSTFITVYETSAVTCESLGTCDVLIDDRGNLVGEPPAGGGGGGGDGVTGVEELLDSPYFWVLFWVLLINIIIAALSWGTRAGFGGIVYGTASLIVYIMGVIFYGVEDVSIWPVVATVVFSLAWGISRWVRS